MQINHLHLHVRDVERTRAFYERWFGMRVKRRIKPGFLFLTDEAGMDLAIVADDPVAPMPDWFHFGFRLADQAAVRALHREMTAAGACDEEIREFPDRITFGVADPDGYGVEVYHEE